MKDNKIPFSEAKIEYRLYLNNLNRFQILVPLSLQDFESI